MLFPISCYLKRKLRNAFYFSIGFLPSYIQNRQFSVSWRVTLVTQRNALSVCWWMMTNPITIKYYRNEMNDWLIPMRWTEIYYINEFSIKTISSSQSERVCVCLVWFGGWIVNWFWNPCNTVNDTFIMYRNRQDINAMMIVSITLQLIPPQVK